MVLFYLLLDFRSRMDAQFSVAHIDHGWRKESRLEYDFLEKLCASCQVPFHGLRLEPTELKGNLEAACRVKRLRHYRSLSQKYGYYAVLLGHHQDDHSETVLKRILEGARIENCRGMSKITCLDGVNYWRPLLDVRKEQLVQWLKDRDIHFFTDDTNNDPKFLRARIRHSIIPELSLQFGKEVGPGLASLGAEIGELGDFFKSYTSSWLGMKQKGSLADWIDLQSSGPAHLFSARYLIANLFPTFSKEMLYAAASAFLKGAANKRFQSANQSLFVDRKRLFCLKVPCEQLSCASKFLKPQGKFGVWEYRIVKQGDFKILRGWRQSVRGELCLPLPSSFKGVTLGFPSDLRDDLERRKINKKRNQQQIPAFLRELVPVLADNGKLIDDFLLEKSDAATPKPDNGIFLRHCNDEVHQ